MKPSEELAMTTETGQNRPSPSTSPRTVFRHPLLISLILFALALLPRLPDLGRFLTADEFLWVDRSRNFVAALTNPAYTCTTPVEAWSSAQGLACTLRTGHPGVTTMWTGSFGLLLRWFVDGRPAGLHDYVVGISTNPLDPTFIAPARLGTVLLTALWVAAVYWLARRLFGSWIALLGAALIALDPFHIALSRVIHHDALETVFMTLSILCLFIYWGEGHDMAAGGRFLYRRRWLLGSGLLAGFAFLSKSPSLYLMPFIAIAGLWFFWQTWRRTGDGTAGQVRPPFPLARLFHLILDGLLWFAVAIAAVFVFWPAMWVIPVETVQTVLFVGGKYATGGHAKGNFFFGDISKDPGPLFYPVTWLYRTSPLVIAGVLAALATWVRPANGQTGQLRSRSSRSASLRSFYRYLPLILIFILGYYLLMAVGEKKQDRYLLPVYPWLNFIAAGGLVAIGSWLSAGLAPGQNHVSRFTFHANTFLLLLILLVNGALVARNFPYYFTYYNPLLGGIKGAARAITIGWGEGLDQAAAYLNRAADPARTRVASWYESTFAPFYDGPSISYSKEKGKALAGDYAIFYINQTQRRYPDDVLFDYFEARFEPEKVITLHGLEYAWIYPSLGVDHYIQDQVYTGIAALLAWQWLDGDRPLVAGQPAGFELYWEYLGKRPDELFFFRLVDGHDRVWAEGLSRPLTAENPPAAQWREGEIIVEQGNLTPPLYTPPGQYRLQIGFYTNAPAVKAGELLFAIPETEALVTVAGPAQPADTYQLPRKVRPINQPLGQALTLLGAAWPGDELLLAPVGDSADRRLTFPVELYWRIERPLSADFALHAGFMDKAGEARRAWFDLSLAEVINPRQTTWQPGDVVHTRWQLDLAPDVAPGQYTLELVLPENTAETLSFGPLVLDR